MAARSVAHKLVEFPSGNDYHPARQKRIAKKTRKTRPEDLNKAAAVREEVLLMFQNLKIRAGQRVDIRFVARCMEEVLAEHGSNFDPAYMVAAILNTGSPFAVNCESIWTEVNPKAISFDGKGWNRVGKGRYRRTV